MKMTSILNRALGLRFEGKNHIGRHRKRWFNQVLYDG
jgi:hypothetical protein